MKKCDGLPSRDDRRALTRRRFIRYHVIDRDYDLMKSRQPLQNITNKHEDD